MRLVSANMHAIALHHKQAASYVSRWTCSAKPRTRLTRRHGRRAWSSATGAATAWTSLCRPSAWRCARRGCPRSWRAAPRTAASLWTRAGPCSCFPSNMLNALMLVECILRVRAVDRRCFLHYSHLHEIVQPTIKSWLACAQGASHVSTGCVGGRRLLHCPHGGAGAAVVPDAAVDAGAAHAGQSITTAL